MHFRRQKEISEAPRAKALGILAKASDGGSVLILTLWVLFFLAALAVAIGGHVSSNMKVATKIKNRVAAYYLARAGVEKAVTEARSDSNAWDSINEPWSSGEDFFHDVVSDRAAIRSTM